MLSLKCMEKGNDWVFAASTRLDRTPKGDFQLLTIIIFFYSQMEIYMIFDGKIYIKERYKKSIKEFYNLKTHRRAASDIKVDNFRN